MNFPADATVHGEPAVALASDRVRAWVTPRGGMVAPVEFTLDRGRVVQPYSLAPWKPADLSPDVPPIIQVLRGDFFCLPFGESPAPLGIHGPTANAKWQIRERGAARVVMTLDAPELPARVTKSVELRNGQLNLYQVHTIEADGRYSYGHHPILEVSENCVAEIRTSEFSFGGVYVPPRPASGEVNALAAGKRFKDLGAAPLAAGGSTTLKRFPIRPGTEDIVMLAGFKTAFAWVAVTFAGYVWFALRRAADFPSTVFWMSDGGRSAPPWMGRHRRRIGIEDVCSHYCDDLETSRRDLLAADGVPTTREFRANAPVRLAHVQGVVQVRTGFGGVASFEPSGVDRRVAKMRDEAGRTVEFPLDWDFLEAQQ